MRQELEKEKINTESMITETIFIFFNKHLCYCLHFENCKRFKVFPR